MWFADSGVPFAAIATGTPLSGISTVRIDNQAAMEALTRRVIADGHRRIAYVAGPDHYSVVAARRRPAAAASPAAMPRALSGRPEAEIGPGLAPALRVRCYRRKRGQGEPPRTTPPC